VEVSLRIALGLMGSHPEDAARVLERLREGDAHAVLAEADDEQVAAVLTALVAPVASRQLALLPAERAADVVPVLSPDRAADLLRRLDEAARGRILALVPDTARHPVERLLRFPTDTAGSMMDPRFVAFHQNRTAEEALAEITESAADLRYYIYVVGDDSTLVGVLSLREAVAAPKSSRLGEVMRRPVATLSARAGRGAILAHPSWKRVPSLPVVDEKGRILGVFRYRTLQELGGSPQEDDQPSALGLALSLGELFWWGASGLFRGLVKEND
jgi:magnesium transporter